MHHRCFLPFPRHLCNLIRRLLGVENRLPRALDTPIPSSQVQANHLFPETGPSDHGHFLCGRKDGRTVAIFRAAKSVN
ncbi:hypothetical protein ZHAS_00015636 [Anopheles sinensis]|uniref:Uncharacterized protein n=1 Tax=Anopheles sinensis TaxID=74873 RepID=A0A084WAZ6_ANOSI|nr:hypothetical protein ZHAS_00015636 [Anopheles sinensis]